MNIIKYMLLFISLTLLNPGCSFDDLISSDDSPSDTREPRDRREPTDPEDPGETNPDEPGTLVMFMPLRVGEKWLYDVGVSKTSVNNDYRIEYVGEETWTCTKAKLTDSTYTFETTFSGDKTISNSESQQQFTETTSATVSFKIKNGALILVEENGANVSPFFGDWLFLIRDNFKICFVDDRFKDRDGAFTDLSYSYELEKGVGFLGGQVIATSDYERTEMLYTLFDHQ